MQNRRSCGEMAKGYKKHWRPYQGYFYGKWGVCKFLTCSGIITFDCSWFFWTGWLSKLRMQWTTGYRWLPSVCFVFKSADFAKTAKKCSLEWRSDLINLKAPKEILGQWRLEQQMESRPLLIFRSRAQKAFSWIRPWMHEKNSCTVSMYQGNSLSVCQCW